MSKRNLEFCTFEFTGVTHDFIEKLKKSIQKPSFWMKPGNFTIDQNTIRFDQPFQYGGVISSNDTLTLRSQPIPEFKVTDSHGRSFPNSALEGGKVKITTDLSGKVEVTGKIDFYKMNNDELNKLIQSCVECKCSSCMEMLSDINRVLEVRYPPMTISEDGTHITWRDYVPRVWWGPNDKK